MVKYSASPVRQLSTAQFRFCCKVFALGLLKIFLKDCTFQITSQIFYAKYFIFCLLIIRTGAVTVREGVNKSKWKFKMAFAMEGGGGLEGVSSATYLF